MFAFAVFWRRLHCKCLLIEVTTSFFVQLATNVMQEKVTHQAQMVVELKGLLVVFFYLFKCFDFDLYLNFLLVYWKSEIANKKTKQNKNKTKRMQVKAEFGLTDCCDKHDICEF